MQADNPFERKLKLVSHMPEGFRDALTFVTDTLDFAHAAAQAVFEDRATPEHALKICELMLAERSRNLDRARLDDRE